MAPHRRFDVLIDLDGTLIDPKPGIIGSVQFALGRLGAPVPSADELLWAIGPPLRWCFPRLLGSAERVEEAIAFYRENYRGGAMFDAAVYGGIRPALTRLAEAGCRLIVATSKPRSFAVTILEHFALAPAFAAIHGAELDGRHDDKGDLIAHIIAEEKVTPARAVMVGDRSFDVLGAKRHGIACIGVTWGYGSATELRDAGAAMLCGEPVQLADVVLGLSHGAS